MGDQREIPLTANTAEQDISGNERLINVYPRKSSGGKYPFNLIGSPGQAFYLELPTSPIKGLHSVGDRDFAVTISKFYEIFNDGTHKELGNVEINGRAVIDDNGFQIVVVDGFKGFSYDFALDTVKEIIAEGFYPARTVTEQDGYFIFDRKGTDQFFISKLLSVEFDALDFAQAGGSTDNLVSVLSDHREVFLFGTKTIRVQYNSGDADFPFELNQGAFIEKGCAAPYSVAKQNNTVYFVGSDLMVYQLAGYSPQRISTHAVEQTLEGVDLSDCFAYTHHEEGHLFYTLTIPNSNITWRYDISTGAWHICKDYQFGRHRSNCKTYSKNSKTLVGDFQSGRVYQLTQDHLLDDGEPIEREFVLPTINNGREFLSIYSFELDMSSGVGTVGGQGFNPKAMLFFSKNNGKTWSNVKFANIGKLGEFLTRVKWNVLGASRQFQLKVRITDPVPIDIGGAYIEI